MRILKNISFLLLVGVVSLSCKKEDNNEISEVNQENVENIIPEDAKLELANATIEGMTCEIGCAQAIESKLKATPGVKEAKVNFEEKTATITYDVNQQNNESLKEIIEGVGGGDAYTVTEIK